MKTRNTIYGKAQVIKAGNPSFVKVIGGKRRGEIVAVYDSPFGTYTSTMFTISKGRVITGKNRE